jgi:hypothetical protein
MRKIKMGLSADSTIKDILDNPQGKEIFRKHLGDEALNNPQLSQAMGFSLRMVQGFIEGQAPGMFTKEMLETVDAELKAL